LDAFIPQRQSLDGLGCEFLYLLFAYL
jgi:hypothetical protein